MKQKLIFFIIPLFIVACKSTSESDEPQLEIKDVKIYTQKPLINLNDTVFFSVNFNSNYKSSLPEVEASLNTKSPIGTRIQYNEISASEYKGYFLPIKTKGEYDLNVKFTKNGKSFSFSKKIKIIDSYSIEGVWEELKNYDETKALVPFAIFKDNYYYTSTTSVGPDFINVGFFFKVENNQYVNFTKFIEGFYGGYSLIYNADKALLKIRIVNDTNLINSDYETLLSDVKKVYGNPVRSGTNQFNGYKFSEFETTLFKIRVEQISLNTVHSEITKK